MLFSCVVSSSVLEVVPVPAYKGKYTFLYYKVVFRINT